MMELIYQLRNVSHDLGGEDLPKRCLSTMDERAAVMAAQVDQRRAKAKQLSVPEIRIRSLSTPNSPDMGAEAHHVHHPVLPPPPQPPPAPHLAFSFEPAPRVSKRPSFDARR